MRDDPGLELSVILPVYNEGPAVVQAIDRYAAALPRCCASYELIVIDDGSADDSHRLAVVAAEGRSWVRCCATRAIGARRRPCSAGPRGGPRGCGDAQRRRSAVRSGRNGLPADLRSRVVTCWSWNAAPGKLIGWWRKLISWCNRALVRWLLGSPFADHNFVQAFL